MIGWMAVLVVLAIFRKRMGGRKKGVQWGLAGFILLVGLSTLHSSHPSWIGNLTEHQGILIFIAYGLLFLLASRINSPEKQQLFCEIFVMGAFFAAVYGIMQYYGAGFLPQDVHFNFGRRAFSFFDNPDYFGSYLVLAIPVNFALYLSAQQKVKMGIYFFILCTLFLALLESETRSAWIGTAAAIILMLVWTVSNRREQMRKWIALIVVFSTIFWVSNMISHQSNIHRAMTISHDVHQIIANENAGAAGASRWYIWQSSLPLIAEHFWLGSGPNTFQFVFHPADQQLNRKYLGNSTIYDENNNYMQIALTMGVPALIIYLLFMLGILRDGFCEVRETNGRRQLLLYGLMAAIVGYLIQAYFNISVVSVAPFFWLFLGLVSSRNYR